MTNKEIELFGAIGNGRVYTKDEIVEKLGMKKNSTFRNLLAGLKKKKVIESKDSVQLTKEMFPFEPRPDN